MSVCVRMSMCVCMCVIYVYQQEKGSWYYRAVTNEEVNEQSTERKEDLTFEVLLSRVLPNKS